MECLKAAPPTLKDTAESAKSKGSRDLIVPVVAIIISQTSRRVVPALSQTWWQFKTASILPHLAKQQRYSQFPFFPLSIPSNINDPTIQVQMLYNVFERLGGQKLL